MDTGSTAEKTPVETWLQRVNEVRKKEADYFKMFDLARRGLAEHPEAMELEYQALLALARAGATNRAQARLADLEAKGRIAVIASGHLVNEFGALEARLFKDRAVEASGEEQTRLLRASAAAYEAVFRRGGDSYYPAINAASMWFLAGDVERSKTMAGEALRLARGEAENYWTLATQGEALVLLDDIAAAAATLWRAAKLPKAAQDEIAATRKQMRWLSKAKGLGRELIDALGEPEVACFLRDRGAAAPAFDGSDAARANLERELDRVLPRAEGAAVYVTLLDPLDICLAEALIARKAQLNLVLSASEKTCLEALEAAAPRWKEPYQRCLDRRSSVSVVTESGEADEPTSLSLCLEQMMGLTLLRAEALDAPARRIAIEAQRSALILTPAALLARKPGRVGAPPQDPPPPVRVKRALVFGDVKGFSTLAERDMAGFLDHVIGGFGDALEPFGAAVEYAETAGDGIYLVVSGVSTAARCCLALQETMRPERLKRVGLPTVQGLRVGAHVGPVSRGYDRVTKRNKFFGTEIIRTARIEPVTEVGAIYVTEQFAATLYCEAGGEFRCEYVGIQPMAKGYGACRMYSLRRSRPGE
ncbi:MAG TPA: adenylate/guanylate cyclase domain-containing protein [Stellaceae bacterium]|nr:adenylate/guanylate cyclase domain-containing protein [Stellaceae bacterium]